jgi:2,4-didehydro-3-deoxy-L-rhamnonate hydrolase
MQDESTIDMTARPLPGDVVLTGSPAGDGVPQRRPLAAGDVMEGSITGLGSQRTRCVADRA